MIKKPLFPPVVLFLVFTIFTFLVHLKLLNGIDLAFTIYLQEVFSRGFDTFFSLFSLFGSVETVVVIIFILWAVYKKLNYLSILFFFGLFHVIEFLGKYFVNHPSPPIKFLRYDIPFSFPSSTVSTGSSFPSGHVGRTFFLAVVIFYIIKKSKLSNTQKNALYAFLGAIILIMFISRVYLGEHWLSDVIGGALLGGSLGALSLFVL